MNPNAKDEEILMRLLDGDCGEEEFALHSERLRTDNDFLALYRWICEFETVATELFPRLGIVEEPTVTDMPAPVSVFPRKYWVPLASAAAAVLIVGTILGLMHVDNVRKESAIFLEFSPSATMSFRPGETLPGTLPIGKPFRFAEGHMAISFQRGKAKGVIESPAEFTASFTMAA